MARTDNEITIAAPLELVWTITNDVASWPTLFSEYAAAEILTTDGDTITFRLTLHPDEQGQRWSWTSERTPDVRTRTVRAHRIETGPFSYMDIFWEYEDTPAGTRMRWVQDFAVRPGLPFGDAEMTERLNTNTRREMTRIKGIVEEVAAEAVAVGTR